jgi:hypothetical protein
MGAQAINGGKEFPALPNAAGRGVKPGANRDFYRPGFGLDEGRQNF